MIVMSYLVLQLMCIPVGIVYLFSNLENLFISAVIGIVNLGTLASIYENISNRVGEG